jgi:Protein of unknown function (DUF1552)
MSKQQRIGRRTVLKGLGTAISLPLLDCMLPRAARGAIAGRPAAPTRMAFLYVPNGIHMPDWTPAATGSDFELPASLRPLAPYKDQLLVLSGLAQDKARANGDGPGDHARALSTFLTGCQAYKTDGANIHVGVSVDQVAAQKIGHRTRFPSLELGCDRGAQSGSCDSGYSCAYSSNISWRTPTTPMAKEIDPRLVFERLFGGDRKDETEKARGNRQLYRKSVLDFVDEDAKNLRARLGGADRRKLDEYLVGVREVEQRIAHAESTVAQELPKFARPDGIPKAYKDHIRLLCDLLVLAFQGDLTRVSTFIIANDGSNRSYAFMGVPEGHHDLSHHGGNEQKQAKIAKINQFHVSQLAYLVDKMKQIQEGEGTLLDHSMVAYGSGIGDGNRHNHDHLPVVLLGNGGGGLRTGRHLRYDKETPLNNLWLSMLDRMEATTEHLGDATGRLEGLSG